MKNVDWFSEEMKIVENEMSNSKFNKNWRETVNENHDTFEG
jgi:hypothetical protein